MSKQPDQLFEKGLPTSLLAERMVLAAQLMGRGRGFIPGTVSVEDFSTERNRRIFSAMVDLENIGTPVDRVTIAQELQRRGQLESVDGLTYLSSIDEDMPEITNIDAYVSIVRDKSTLRQAIFAHQRAIEECIAAVDPTPDILERAERTIAQLSTETRAVTFRTPMDVVNRAGGIGALLHPDPVKSRAVETPWPQLNRMLVGRGFLPGQMVVIGARPSMGKPRSLARWQTTRPHTELESRSSRWRCRTRLFS